MKHIALKALMLVGLLTVLNFVYKWAQYDDEVLADFPVWPELKEAGEADIVYLGESSNVTTGDYDMDKSPIHSFLQAHFPIMKVAGITQPAAHAGHYLTMLQNIPSSSNVKAVVVTMNLRSFNAQWRFSKQEPALSKKMVLIGQGPALYRKFLLSMRKYYRSTDEKQIELFQKAWREDSLKFPFPVPFRNLYEWDSTLAKRNAILPTGKKNPEITLSTHYVKAYGFQIDSIQNPRIADFDAIVKLSQKRGWKLVLNLLPENTGRAESLLGDTLTYFMHQNVDFLVRRYSQPGVTVVNQLDLLENSHFIDQNWTTEHYDEFGRRRVAQQLAMALKEFFPNEWVKVPIQDEVLPGSFSNDCEGGQKWLQMQTCVTGPAKSGKKSSKVGGAEKFSITLSVPIAKIESWQRDVVEVSFWMYQENRDHLAGLAFEASGDSVAYMWDTLGLRQSARPVQSWEKVHLEWPVKPEVKKADLMKIYVYNPSEQVVWIDDIVIRFK